jgi:hypothetical protein
MVNHSIIDEQESQQFEGQGNHFILFREKIRLGLVLSFAMEKILRLLNFTGKIIVQVQNGRVLKVGYEEGYFRQSVER